MNCCSTVIRHTVKLLCVAKDLRETFLCFKPSIGPHQKNGSRLLKAYQMTRLRHCVTVHAIQRVASCQLLEEKALKIKWKRKKL